MIEGARSGHEPDPRDRAAADDGPAGGSADVEAVLADVVERRGEDRDLAERTSELLDRLEDLEEDLKRRDIELRDLIETVVAKTIAAETGQLRDEVTRELERLEQRVERLLGSGLVDVGAALGDELQTLRTRVALARDERRTDIQIANRIQAMEDRLDRLIRSVSARPTLSRDEITSELNELNDDLSETVRRANVELEAALRGSNDDLATTLRGSNDELAAALSRANEELAATLSATVSGEGSRTRETVDDLADDLGGRLDTVPSEARLVAVYERLEDVLHRLREEREAVEQRLEDGLVQGREDVAQRLDLTMERHRDEVGEELSRIFDQLSRAQAETESREAARRAELLDHLETLFDGGLAELRRAADRLAEEVAGLGPLVSDQVGEVVAELGGHLDRLGARIRATAEAVHSAETRVLDRTSTGLREFEHRIVARTGEQAEAAAETITGRTGEQTDEAVGELADRTVARLDDLDERTRDEIERIVDALGALDEQVRRTAEQATQLGERVADQDPEGGRRELLADIATALEGRVCPACGFVARSERGLSVHQRKHT